jgi:hypothetical protein
MTRFLATAALACIAGAAASAQEANTTARSDGDPTEIVETLVKDTHEDKAGRVQPSSGGAKPIENWMACRDLEGARDDCQPEEQTAPQG